MFNIKKHLFLLALISRIILPQENYEVTGISFEGNKTIESGTLSDAITFTSTGWFAKLIQGEEAFLYNSEILDNDVINIIKLYQREGFLFTTVNPEQILNDKDKEVQVLFRIEEGPPILVDSVVILLDNKTQNKFIDSLNRLASEDLVLVKDKRFRDEDIRADETMITNYYINNGYPHVKINFDLHVDTLNYLVAINWHVNTGEVSRFGNTTISGLDYYSEEFIRSKLNYSDGEIFNAEKLEETRMRLYDLGVFYNVSFSSILNSNPSDVVPVNLKLTEAKRFKITAGAGYGHDEKFRGAVELTLLGFLKGPGRINFKAKKSAIEKFSYELGYSLAEFLWPRTSFKLNTFTNKVDEVPYKQSVRGFSAGILKSFYKYFLAAFTFEYENVDLDVTSIAVQPDTSLVMENYKKPAANITLSFSTRQPYNSPAQGFTISLSTTFSGIGDVPYQFLKSIIDLRKYNRLFGSTIAAMRLSVGYMYSYNDPDFVPVEERFYLGGSSSVRGWERFQLSPKDSAGKPQGGNSFIEGGIEFRYPYPEELYGVLFLDFGNVWSPSMTYHFNELQYAIGIGLRYATPIGPVRVDVATPIFNENKETQFWFSIGHAF